VTREMWVAIGGRAAGAEIAGGLLLGSRWCGVIVTRQLQRQTWQWMLPPTLLPERLLTHPRPAHCLLHPDHYLPPCALLSFSFDFGLIRAYAMHRRCLQCDTATTTKWRSGPAGRKTLCNRCSKTRPGRRTSQMSPQQRHCPPSDNPNAPPAASGRAAAAGALTTAGATTTTAAKPEAASTKAAPTAGATVEAAGATAAGAAASAAAAGTTAAGTTTSLDHPNATGAGGLAAAASRAAATTNTRPAAGNGAPAAADALASGVATTAKTPSTTGGSAAAARATTTSAASTHSTATHFTEDGEGVAAGAALRPLAFAVRASHSLAEARRADGRSRPFTARTLPLPSWVPLRDVPSSAGAPRRRLRLPAQREVLQPSAVDGDGLPDPEEFRSFSPVQVGAAVAAFASVSLSPDARATLLDAFTRGAVDGNIVGIVAVEEDLHHVLSTITCLYRHNKRGLLPYGTAARVLRFLRHMR